MASAMASMACAICGSAFSTAAATVWSCWLMMRAISSAVRVSRSDELGFWRSVPRSRMGARLAVTGFISGLRFRRCASDEEAWALKVRYQCFQNRIVERRHDLFDGLRTAVRPGAVG